MPKNICKRWEYIMSKVSEILKGKRAEKNLELKDISKTLKISVEFLEKIENNRIKELPSYIHAFGFVKSYAKYLGLDETEIEKLFKEEYKKEDFLRDHANSGSSSNSKEAIKIKQVKKKYPVALIIIVILLFITGFIYFNQLSKNNINSSKSSTIFIDNISDEFDKIKHIDNITEKDNLSENLKSDNESEAVNGNNTQIDYQAIAREILNSDADKTLKEPNKIKLHFNDICWIHIKTDNKTVHDFIAEKDMVKVINFYDFFVIDIGNAAALTIEYNNQFIRNFGGFREPVKNLYFYLDENGTLVYKK
jgi:cytoskeletal protein RodZ